MIDEEILQVTHGPSLEEDNQEIADKLVVPRDHMARQVRAFPIVLWLEAQTDFDPVSVQLLCRLQQKLVNKRATALKQQHINDLFRYATNADGACLLHALVIVNNNHHMCIHV